MHDIIYLVARLYLAVQRNQRDDATAALCCLHAISLGARHHLFDCSTAPKEMTQPVSINHLCGLPGCAKEMTQPAFLMRHHHQPNLCWDCPAAQVSGQVGAGKGHRCSGRRAGLRHVGGRAGQGNNKRERAAQHRAQTQSRGTDTEQTRSTAQHSATHDTAQHTQQHTQPCTQAGLRNVGGRAGQGNNKRAAQRQVTRLEVQQRDSRDKSVPFLPSPDR